MAKARRSRKRADPGHELKTLLHLTRLAELGRLSASVAHEINNPLMVAQGSAENIELLLGNAKELQADDIRVQALEIIKACVRMSRIITKMNKMSRNQKVRFHVVDVCDLVLSAIDFLRIHFEDLNIKLTLDLDQPMAAKCDSIQIEQVILNILNNAIHALEKIPRDREIRIRVSDMGEEQRLYIFNNGPPIPKRLLSRLMTPFTSTKSEGRGVGLGLAISKSIMALHDGNLKCVQSNTRGTEFMLSFPRAISNPWMNVNKGASGRIIVIDRQQAFRRMFSDKFRRVGFNVDDVADNNTGLLAAKENRPIAVFVNIIPGHAESLAVIAKLRANLGPTALIFAMSSYFSATNFRQSLVEVGANEVFEKPIHADLLDHILLMISKKTSAAA